MATDTTLRPGEIKDILLREIEAADLHELDVEEVGTVLEVKDGIARIYGLQKAMAGEMLEITSSETANKITELALNLEEDNIGAVVLGDYLQLKEGDEVRRTSRVLEVPVGPSSSDASSTPSAIRSTDRADQRQEHAQSRAKRLASSSAAPVKEPLQTGIKAIDSMIPIGRGQRQLIISTAASARPPSRSTRSSIRKTGRHCVYVAIGQKRRPSSVVAPQGSRRDGVLDRRRRLGIDPAPMWYIAPYSGCAMASIHVQRGKPTLCVYDDLSKQAAAYRQLSLVLLRPPGREAFPADVFYLHSRLLERAAKLREDDGIVDGKTLLKPGGSLTALPIIETQAGDVSAYIPTNVISITDGQIFLESDLFFAGVRPAINAGISVSRVGGSAQVKAMRSVAGRLRLDPAQFR